MDGLSVPETRYARSGDVSVAYQVLGEGPLDLVYAPTMSNLELAWENSASARFLNRLALICRLIMFNQRGTGMSDRVTRAHAGDAHGRHPRGHGRCGLRESGGLRPR